VQIQIPNCLDNLAVIDTDDPKTRKALEGAGWTPPPAPERFKVPVVEIYKRDDGEYNVFANNLLLASIPSPSCSSTANWLGDLCMVGAWQAIAHACKMAGLLHEWGCANAWTSAINDPAAYSLRNIICDFNAGPVKPQEGETQAG